jgi:Protein of unknown function (DUF1254)
LRLSQRAHGDWFDCGGTDDKDSGGETTAISLKCENSRRNKMKIMALVNQPNINRRDAMKGGVGLASLAAVCGGAAAPAAVSTSVVATTDTARAQASGAMSPPTEPATGIVMQPDYARTIAQMAYVWGWPIVNMINRRAAITQAPQPGHLNGVLPAAPRGQIAMLADYIEPSETFVTCPNQDVVYGLGFFSLDEEPVVIQVPDFGDRFWVYALYDARTDQFGQLGKPYNSKPGFYLLVGPRWRGLKPTGITDVIRCSTSLGNAIPRVFQDDTPEDKKAIQPVINQIVAYPLKDFTGQMKRIEWSKVPNIPGPKSTGEETKWVIPEKFFDQFGEALDMVFLARRGSAVRAVPLVARCGGQGPGTEKGAGRDRRRDRAKSHPSVLRVETQRTSGRQRMEPLNQQCTVGNRLFQPDRNGKIKHVR